MRRRNEKLNIIIEYEINYKIWTVKVPEIRRLHVSGLNRFKLTDKS